MKARPVRMLGWIAMSFAASGCAGEASPPPAHPGAADATMGEARHGEGGVADAWIAAVLGRELRADAVLADQLVGVDSVLGVVKLEGVVDSRLAKQRALEIARVVRGVRAIIDRIEVAQRPRPDQELDFAVAGALGRDPITAGQRIAARTHEGVVTLSGDVGSEAERRIAEADVLALPGVRDVVDVLLVHARHGDDARTAAAAARVLHDDPWLDDAHLRVEAKRGTVRLSGAVSSAQEWARAERDAATAAPRGAVDVSALHIERAIADGTLRGASLVTPSDSDLSQALLDAFVRDPRVQPFVPTIEIHDGFVILTGVAPTTEAVRAAEEDARNVPGINTVRCEIKASSSVVSQSDAAVRNHVAAALARDPVLAHQDVAVVVRDGRVLLRGTVATESDRAHAVSLATSAPGARDVQDALVLAPPRLGVTNRQKPR